MPGPVALVGAVTGQTNISKALQKVNMEYKYHILKYVNVINQAN